MTKEKKKRESTWFTKLGGSLKLVKLFINTHVLFFKAQSKKRKLRETQQLQNLEQINKDFCNALLNKFHFQTNIQTEKVEPSNVLKSTPHGRLVISNHRSVLDILLLTSIFGGKLVSRSDVQKWPLFGKIAKSVDTIFVDRDDPWSGAKTIRKIRKQLKEGNTVIVFPEGKTYAYPTLGNFQQGAFASTQGLQTILVPVAIAYPPGFEYVNKNFKEHLIDILNADSIPIKITIGASFLPKEKSKQTMFFAREKIEQLMIESQNRLHQEIEEELVSNG